jgi:hypothetical protein
MMFQPRYLPFLQFRGYRDIPFTILHDLVGCPLPIEEDIFRDLEPFGLHGIEVITSSFKIR